MVFPLLLLPILQLLVCTGNDIGSLLSETVPDRQGAKEGVSDDDMSSPQLCMLGQKPTAVSMICV